MAMEGVELRQIEPYGLSAVAARDFDIGETVFSDEPFCTFAMKEAVGSDPDPLSAQLAAIAKANYLDPALLSPLVPFSKMTDEEVQQIESELMLPVLDPTHIDYKLFHGACTQAAELEANSRTADQCYGLIMRIRVNAHLVYQRHSDQQEPQASFGLFGLGSKVNHSCDPNTMCLVQGTTLFYRATQPIAKGDILTFSYLPDKLIWTPTECRRKYLSERRFFACACSRCQLPDELRTLKCPTCQKCTVKLTRPLLLEENQPTNSPRADAARTCANCEKDVENEAIQDLLELERTLQKMIERLLAVPTSHITPEMEYLPFNSREGWRLAFEKLGEMHWCTIMFAYIAMVEMVQKPDVVATLPQTDRVKPEKPQEESQAEAAAMPMDVGSQFGLSAVGSQFGLHVEPEEGSWLADEEKLPNGDEDLKGFQAAYWAEEVAKWFTTVIPTGAMASAEMVQFAATILRLVGRTEMAEEWTETSQKVLVICQLQEKTTSSESK